MRVLAVVSQKGGSGKTTLSGHLAVQATLAGDGPVAVIDTDPQGSLAAWWNERQVEEPLFVKTTLRELGGHLDELRRAGVKLVVIDTPPAITMAIQEVIEVADQIIVPTKPSPHDLRAVGATVKLIERVNKPMLFVVNDATPRARITSEAAIALSQHGTVAPITVHHRTDFASSMIDGRTVMELKKKSRSAAEIKGLWEYIYTRLQRQVSNAAFHMHNARYDDVNVPSRTVVREQTVSAAQATEAPAPQPQQPLVHTPDPQPDPQPQPLPVAATAQPHQVEEPQVLPFDALINETDRKYVSPSWLSNSSETVVEAAPAMHPSQAPEPPVPDESRAYVGDHYNPHARGFGRRSHAN